MHLHLHTYINTPTTNKKYARTWVGAHIPMFMSQVCDDEKWHSMHDIGAHTHTLSRCRYLDISANTGLVCVPLSLVILIYSRCLCPHTAIFVSS
jgi:hypothetical protein